MRSTRRTKAEIPSGKGMLEVGEKVIYKRDETLPAYLTKDDPYHGKEAVIVSRSHMSQKYTIEGEGFKRTVKTGEVRPLAK